MNKIMTPEMQELKTRLKATWSAGDFGVIAKNIEHEGIDFVKRLNIPYGSTVLDVACGTGNLAIPAAKKGAIVSGVDLAANLIDQAIKRARNEGVTVKFEVGDAEDLPYEDAEFDIVMSMFGAMFAPRPHLAGSELLRVCKPGGLVAMANWTPDGFAGKMLKAGGKYVPPPTGMEPPVLWGKEDVVRERLADGVADLQMIPRKLTFTYPFGPVEVVDEFCKYFGPMVVAFSKLDLVQQAAYRGDLETLWSENNQATDGTTQVEAEYLEVRATKK